MLLEDKRPKLQLLVVVGLGNTLAVLKAESSIPGVWEGELENVGSLYPDHIGIPLPPEEPGMYEWNGVLATFYSDVDGEFDSEFQGEWTQLSHLGELCPN